ncbi:TapY2 family type IVa secretion system protein [Psychromonas sp.]|nr:TapY2 family type IVa secretion system protein [Psychromonas sp.]
MMTILCRAFPGILAMTTLLVFTSSLSYAAEERVTYTCFVELEDQSKVVHQFVYKNKNKEEFLLQLPGSTAYSSDGITGLKIKSVMECVTGNATFKNKDARVKSETTPM